MDTSNLNKSYINGEWVEGNAQSYQVLNPYDNSVLSEIKLADKEQTKNAIEVAKQSFQSWSEQPELRKQVLEDVKQYFEDNKDDIIELLAKDSGSTYIKGQMEFATVINCFNSSIKLVDELGYKTLSEPGDDRLSRYYRKPKGVISSISPFNFPMFLSLRTIIPALALGNAVVHKGDVQTAFTGGKLLAKAFDNAGIPKGVFNVLLTKSSVIGDMMFEDPSVNFVSFTGSTKVGQHIGGVAGQHLKQTALELGGNGPFVVLEDANVDDAVDAAIFGKFIHQGQICMIINRMIVHQDLYDEFVEKFVKRAQELKYGDPLDKETVVGPIINQQQLDKIKTIIQDAKDAGTTVALDGQQVGNVLTPTVFKDVDNQSELAQEEIFGPVATIIKADSDEDAIAKANDTEYGLSSAIFTSDLERGEQIASNLEFGMVHVNDQTVATDEYAPFGGIKNSGIGRFGTPFIIDEFTELKWVTVQQTKRSYPF